MKFTMVNDISFRMGFFSVGRAKCDIKGKQIQVKQENKTSKHVPLKICIYLPCPNLRDHDIILFL